MTKLQTRCDNVLQSLALDVLQHHVFSLLNVSDLMNLSFTNQSFHKLILRSSSQLWEHLYAQDYKVSSSKQQLPQHDDDWYQQYKQRKELDVTVLPRIKCMEDDESNWISLLLDGPDIVDQLFRIIQQQQQQIVAAARQTIVGIHRLETCWEWYQLMKNTTNVDMEMGAILLSKIYQTHPFQNNSSSQINNVLQQKAIQLQQRLTNRNISAHTVTTMKHKIILQEMKHFFQSVEENQATTDDNNDILKGNMDNYYDYQNSLLDRILLHTKKGIPITLSIIYASIVRRATGIQMDPVGIPGHFLLSIGTGQDRLFVDAFDGGKLLTMKDCVQIVQIRYGQQWHDSMANPISNHQVWARMVRNLLNCHCRIFQFRQIMYGIDMFLLKCAEKRIPNMERKEEILQSIALKIP